jgi:hypothetical protein
MILLMHVYWEQKLFIITCCLFHTLEKHKLIRYRMVPYCILRHTALSYIKQVHVTSLSKNFTQPIARSNLLKIV